MITIRRLYLYIVCFISLQVAANALVTLLGGVVTVVVGADRPPAVIFTLQLAVLIVATPIFIGHWLWALYLARRDPTEHNAFLYRLYLYATLGMFVGALAVALFRPVEALSRFVLLRSTTDLPAVSVAVGASLITVISMGALWVYHQRLATRPSLAHTTATRTLYHLYTLGWAGVGATLAAIGAFLVQAAVIDRLFGNPSEQAPLGLGLLAAGLPLWLYHEWQYHEWHYHEWHRRHAQGQAAPIGDGLRWIYTALFSAGGVILFLIGLSDLLTRLSELVFLGALDHPPYALAILTTGLALWGYHELALRRVPPAGLLPFRWLYALLFSAVGLLAAVSGGVALLHWLFGGLRAGVSLNAGAAAPLLPGLIVWGYHQWLFGQTSRALDLASPAEGPFRATGRLLRRLYLLVFSGAGVTLTTLGLIGVQEALYTGLRGQVALGDALAWLIVGLPLWLYHWLWAGRLFRAGLPDERQSDLRKLYLYLIIFAAVNTVIVTAGVTLSGVFRALLGLPTTGRLGYSIAIILAAIALWAYHAWVLRGDIARAATSSLQGSLQRLYWYLVATFGLAAFLLGLAGVLSDAIGFVAAGLHASSAWREQFSTNLAALVAGLPVWLLAWWPAQAATRLPGPAGVSARRSWLRRLYLYGFALVAIIVTLVSAIAVVYQILNGLFRLSDGGNVLANLARGAGFAVIGTAVWLFHGWLLRQDGKLAPADRALEAEKRAAEQAALATARAATRQRWAGMWVAIMDDGDGRFARLAVAALRRDLPALNLLPIGLSPAASAALSGDPLVTPALPPERSVFAAPPPTPLLPEQLAQARLIIAPWTAAAREPLLSSRLPKIIVPLPGRDVYWAGVNPDFAAGLPSDPGPQLARTVEAALSRLTSDDTPLPVNRARPSAPPPVGPPTPSAKRGSTAERSFTAPLTVPEVLPTLSEDLPSALTAAEPLPTDPDAPSAKHSATAPEPLPAAARTANPPATGS